MATTTTLSTILQNMGESIDDHLEFATTTNITTNNSIISTELIGVDRGSDDHFIGWKVYIGSGNNDTKYRYVSDYATATGTLTVRGVALVAETGAVTCQLHKYDRTKKVNAVKRTVNELFPSTRIDVDNMD